MYIQKLTIENIRGVKHLKIIFPENPAGWHVIIGDNGAGKSTVIRAIALGLIGPAEVRAAHPNFAEWLSKGAKSASVELDTSWDSKYDSAKGLGKTRTLIAKVLLQPSHPLNGLLGGVPLVEAMAAEHKKLAPGKYLWSNKDKGWFSAGFGPFRRFTGGDTEHDKVYLSSPRCGAHLSVFGEDVALTEALRWLQEIDYQQLKSREKKARFDIDSFNKVDTISESNNSSALGEIEQLWDIARRLKKNSLFSEAESLLRRALSTTEKVYGPDHSNVATSLNNLAILLHETNRFAEAEPLLRRALAIEEANLGPDHSSVATSLNNLASVLQETNRLAEAEPLLRRALAIEEVNLGPDHSHVATNLNNLAILLQEKNQFAEAEPLLRRALAIEEANLGPDHSSVATSLNNLASLLQITDRLTEAEPLFRRSLAIDEVNLGSDHPGIAIRLNNLANLLRDTNRMEEAEPLVRRALAISEASFGPDHPNVATNLNSLAGLLQVTNRLTEAEPLFRRALIIDESSFGIDHPRVAIRLNNLADLLVSTNRLEEAEPLLRRAIIISENSFGPNHPKVAIRLGNLANLLAETNRVKEAETLMRQALSIVETSYGPTHSAVGVRLNNLANLLVEDERLDEAEMYYRRALDISKNALGSNHPDVRTCLKNLKTLLSMTDRADEAKAITAEYESKESVAQKQHISAVTNNIVKASQKLPLDDNSWLALQLRTFINESKLLPIGVEFRGMSSDGPVFRDGNGQLIPVTQLSDGFRSILSLSFELIRQLIRVYGLIAVFPPNWRQGVIELPGVVLIDEVDTHLHPTWQTRIGPWFTKCFPQMQFIVTTHSPLICRAVTETTGSIWRLPTLGQGQAIEEVTGHERQNLRLGTVLDAYGTGLFGGQEVEQAVEATELLAERARLSAKESVGKATPNERKRLRELRQLFSPADVETEY